MPRHPSLQQVAVMVPPGIAEVAAEVLEAELGEPSATYEDLTTGLATVSVYLSRPATRGNSVRARLRQALARRGVGAEARLSMRRVAPRDWSESWRRHFQPIDVRGRLLVKPTWSKRRAKSGQAVVVLDPGLSFGTGQHATTRFCLEQLVKLRRPNQPQSLLDAGTGSGILAIAAAKLGYEPTHAFDFDAEAVRIAAENCRLNQVESVRLAQADLTRLPPKSRTQFDVVCANLMADLLIAERDRLLARVKPGGDLILAGILTAQFADVERAFAKAGVRRIQARTEGEWRSGQFRWRAHP